VSRAASPLASSALNRRDQGSRPSKGSTWDGSNASAEFANLYRLTRPAALDHDRAKADAAHLFFQLVSRRYETGAMLITSNRSVAEWGTVFADPVVATAILDRPAPQPRADVRGDSYRLRAKRKSGLIKPPAADGPPVGSAPLRAASGGANLQPTS